MTCKITPTQKKVLTRLQERGENRPMHKSELNTRWDVLERLLEAGLIESERPFRHMFYHITITQAGREALK